MARMKKPTKNSVRGTSGKRKAPREAHLNQKQERNQPFRVKAVGGGARPPKSSPMGRPQGKVKRRGVGGKRKTR